MPKITLKLLPQVFAIHRLPAETSLDAELAQRPMLFVARTDDELSVLCPQQYPVSSERSEAGWRGLKVLGPLAFDMVGILAALATCLAKRQIPIFAISTFDTDYLFIKEHALPAAQRALQEDGYQLQSDPDTNERQTSGLAVKL